MICLYFLVLLPNLVQGAPPTFTNINSGTVLNVAEDAALNYKISTASATDPDLDHFTFSLTVAGGGPFSIGSSSGEIIVNAANTLDYETTVSYSVTVSVTDSNSESSDVTITINVDDVNDNSPTITITDVDITMDEETAAGTTVPFDLTTDDPDTTPALSYSLMGTDSSIFNIDQTTSVITLNSKIDTDPNQNKIYKPVFKVFDGINSATATLTLTLQDINDNSPICSPMIVYRSLVEETSGALYSLTCTDGDSALNGNNVLTYSIIVGDTTKFSVDASSGAISANAIDYETTTSETLQIKVSDGPATGKLSTTATIIISITAVNDNEPTWATWSPPLPSGDKYAVNENIGVGTTIFTMVADDDDIDVGGTVTYSATSISDGTNPVTGVFNVEPNTGEVTTLSSLDADAGITQYTFNMRATDGGTGLHIISKTVYLSMTDVNDNSPTFLGTPFSTKTIAETSAKTGSLVTAVSASDDDVTPATLTYTVGAVVQGTTDPSHWKFSTTIPGRLEFATALDLDSGTSSVSVLRLLVTDGGSPALTGTATLTVSIVADNEFTPTIATEPGASVISIAENEPVGTSVTEVIGADNDVGDEGVLAYSIAAGNTANAFGIDSTGRISTQVVLDKETMADSYQLIVKIQDSGSSPKSVTTTVTVTVTDVNDNQPSCTFSFKSVTVPEDTAVNDPITTLSCTDADSDDVLTYTVKPPHNTVFGVTGSQVTLLTALDYDSATQTYNVEVDVSDGSNSLTVDIAVNVGAVNENTPTFATNPTVSVTENTISNPVTTYTATDADYSPHNIVSYIIQSVTNSRSSLFAIDTSTGDISLKSALDYDSLPTGDKTYKLTVVATDGGGLKGTGTVTVSVTDANDNAPVCSQTTYTVDLDETQGGTGPYTVIAALGCNDVEDGTSLTYALTQTPGTHFTATADKVQLTADTLDFETSASHTLTIEVKDSGTPVQTTTLSVYVYVTNLNEGGPSFPSATPVSIDETIGIGQSVVDVAATDPDGNDPVFGDLQYSIFSGDSGSKFLIDVETGRISTRKALDFETTSSYSLVVQAKERGGANSATVTQAINLNDINDEYPSCSPSTLSATVAETEAVDFVVVNFACVDNDAGTTLTYTITSGDTNLFKMDGSQLKLKAPLDYETATSHDLTITVSDSDPSHNVVISGTVNVGSADEGPPVFTSNPYLVSVNEDHAVSSVVQTVNADDPDSASDANGQVTYSFSASYPQFVIDQSTGQILLAQSLDRETTATYVLIVKAADATGFNTATVSIAVSDSNDNTPQFSSSSYSGTISESDSAGTSVLTVTATDLDDPATNNYGTVSYGLTGSSDFTIDPTTGVITSTAGVSADSGNNFYSLTVTATDSGGLSGARTGSALVTVTVTSVNQHAPVFNPVTTSVTVDENQFSVGDIIATVTATDADTGTDGNFQLTFVNAQSKFSLIQNGNLGEIHLSQNLDFDSGDTTFTIEIKATDQGAAPRSATGTVLITVNDVNDNSPLCTSIINVDKAEGGTDITTLSCSDPDPGTILTYTLISTTPNSISPTVSNAGVVTVGSPLDYESSSAHTIIIQVQDDGSPIKSTSVTISLQITDLNDNDPTMSGSFAFTVSETDSASSTVLYTATANSNDGPSDVITYSLSDRTYFDISAGSGEITLKTSAPDYETVGGSYTMDVCAEDTANPTIRSVGQTITVTITDVNDMVPVFNPAVYSASVAENGPAGTTVTPVTATDGDTSPAYNTITYSIDSGDPAGEWSISNTGALTNAVLDYETRSSYSLVIEASDGTHTTTVNYNIFVTPVNEYDPVFSSISETKTIGEDAAVGTTLAISAVATDTDGGPDGELTYSIDPGPFSIDSVSGVITLSSALDRETTPLYTLTVWAVDKGASPKTGSLSLTVSITDVNDNSPTCSSSVYSASVQESAPTGTAVTTLVCTDDDDDPANLNNALKYTTTSGATSVFSIDSSGVITNTATLDRETTPSYQLIVEVADQSPSTKLTFTATVSVTILDVNDNAPTFSTLPPSVNVPEDTALGTAITTVAATDSDSGVNQQLEYQITNGNTGNKFFIDSSSGEIILQSSLDYETQPQLYNLEITVLDKGSPVKSATGTTTITVTDASDNSPVCATSLYTATVPENSANTPVLSVSCTDADAADSITYSITAGNTNGVFTIDGTSGAIRTSNGANIDYETTQSYTLTVTASDGMQVATTTVKVTISDVNEFDPEFSPTGPYSVTLSEDVNLGHTVMTVAATDSDTFDSVKIYSISAGNSEGKFLIDSATGQIKVQDYLDYETTTTYALSLQVEDSGGKTSSTILDITIGDVNDNDPVCSEAYVTTSIDEGINSASLYTPTCSDADTTASPTLEYTITSGNHASINIDSNTGELTLVAALDYEVVTSLDLIIQVSDKVTPTPKTTTINVNIKVVPVNEHDPVFTPTATYGTYSVPEDTTTGTSIAQVTATDADSGFKHGTVRYTINGGDPQQQFGIDGATGVIKVVKALDREATTSYSLSIRAADDEPGAATERTADATVLIDISDTNDNTPVFSPTIYTADVVETASYGPAVVLKTLTVKDDDTGANGDTTITIISGNNEGKFSISGNTLHLIAQLDYETTTYYELILQVADGGTPSLKSAGRLVVNVLPANEEAPLMTTANSVETILEDVPVGTLVFDANATDSDGGIDGQITYSIVSGVPGNEFIIDSSTGQLYVGSELDYDTVPNSYSIIIKATDGSGASDATTSTVSLSVILDDVNDHIPQFTSSTFNFNVNENVAAGTSVGTVVATDNDSGVNGDVTYTKIGGSGQSYFNIDSASGVVTTAADIDYETFQVLYLSISAQDGGTPSYTSTGLVKIAVNNMNDNDPVLTYQEFAVIVSERTVVGAIVHTSTASDADTPINGFSLVPVSSYFQVASSTGEITTTAMLDRESQSVHILTIQVIDQTTSVDPTVRTATGTVTVIIEDINDNDPVIHGTYTPSIPEDSQINTFVCNINATDADANENAQLDYSITGGNTGNAFKIDSVGNIQVAGPLDREMMSSYTLTVLVRDKGTPPRSDQVDVIVTIDDTNDNDPVFTAASYTFNVPENSNAGTVVGSVTATDADVGANGALTYSIDSYTAGPGSHFAIDGGTGAITIASTDIDRETADTYVARIKVTDSGSPLARTAFTEFTIRIDDLNDNSPIFDSNTYNTSVDENSPTSTSIIQLVATDADLGANAAITYSIHPTLLDGSVASTHFQIGASSGEISPKTATIDYETHKVFEFVVCAIDGGSPALTGTATVTVHINDVNDNRPVFSPTFYNSEVAYTGHCQSSITTVSATDADSGNNGLVSYSLQTAAYDYLFAMGSSTGELRLRSIAETYKIYVLDIQASDAGSPILTAATAAKVRVDAYNPDNHVVTFRLKISRASFVPQQATFIANLQAVLRNVYFSALVRLWCIEEYDGVAEIPASGRRKLLAENPVDVHMYVVRDDSTESLSNINSDKGYVTQDEFFSKVSLNPEGDPGSNIQGTAWDYYRIESVRRYHDNRKTWWDQPYGVAITVIVCLLALVFLGLLIFFIVRCICGQSRRTPRKKKIRDVRPSREEPVKPFQTQPWETNKGMVPDAGGQPYRKAFPPMLITNPETPRVSTATSFTTDRNNLNSPSVERTPRSILITTNNSVNPDYNIDRQFDGKAYDHSTGKTYEYNTKTNERRWL